MKDSTEKILRTGISTGTALAMCISWSLHQSIVWAWLHGLCSWLYVLYFAVTRP